MHGVYKERIPDEVIPRLAAAGIPEVATLTVFDSYADLYEGRREATALERETVPARILDAFVPVPANGRPAEFETFFALVAAGLTPAQALRAATSDAARFVTGTTLTSTVPVRVFWTATDSGSGLAGYDFLEKIDATAWATRSERQLSRWAISPLRPSTVSARRPARWT